MIIIHHRINNIESLKMVPQDCGIELDVRYHNNELVLVHDPFGHHTDKLCSFEALLKLWSHQGPLIVNIKSEGIEEKCIELLNQYKIDNWFFLDLSMPYFVKYAKRVTKDSGVGFSERNLAVRFSDFEPIEYALSFAGDAKWVWVDSFSGKALDKNSYVQLKEAGFSLCLVSPELQKYSVDVVKDFVKSCKEYKIDAVCTKYPELWA